MQYREIYEGLASVLGEASVAENVPMKDFTSFRIGGNARFMVSPDTKERVGLVVEYLNEIKCPYLIIGRGTNLVFSDNGYDGVILRIGPQLSQIVVHGNIITAQGGASLASVASRALEEGLAGFEFASGIPGTMGGGVAMNAGAYGGEMCQVVRETECLDRCGNLVRLKGEDHQFGYRRSRIQSEGLIALEVTIELEKGDKSEIRNKMADLNARRRDKQPLEMPSAGSVFKRPEGCFAGKLIEESGLKGCTIGGAQVSEKHCGFIINTGNATSRDVLELIEHIRKTVYERKGVLLEPEVKIIGG